ncbi:MAG: ferrous iron transport protein B [Candidatus Zhuqueibacterota bacterium]
MEIESIPFHENVILLVGNPNVGKTTIFNQFASKYAITANYPYTTVEVNKDRVRIEGKEFVLIDTAGIYRLDHPSEEGQVTRDLMFLYHPEIIIQVIEAANLEGSLTLTAQLLDLKIPMILVLNMYDELVRQGLRVNAKALSEQLGVPVVEAVAIEGEGIDRIKKAIRSLKPPEPSLKYPRIIENFMNDILNLFPIKNRPARPIIALLALDDPFASRWIYDNYGPDIAQKAEAAKSQFVDKNIVNLSISIMNSQNAWINSVVERVVTRKGELTKFGIQKFGQWSRHPVYGWFIGLGMIIMTYLIVGKFGASFLVSSFDHYLIAPIIRFLDGLIQNPLLNRFLIGDYGLLTTGLFNAVVTVLPIITLFFLVLNLLEDVGYLTNLLILTNRVFKKVGLSGKSILPIVLGFGCKTMATLSTKILDSKKEKYIAIFLIGLAIPCSSQMSVSIGVLSTQPLASFVIVIATLAVIELFAGVVLNKIIPQSGHSDFIMEIPPIRLPDLRLLLKKTYYRSLWFLKEAVPLFLLGALVLFVLNETSGMKMLEWVMRPVVVSLLHLPIEFTEALVMSFARSEAGAALVLAMVKKSALTQIQAIVSIIVLTLFVPCISNVMAMVKELGMKKALLMVFVITITSFLVGAAANLILEHVNYGGSF